MEAPELSSLQDGVQRIVSQVGVVPEIRPMAEQMLIKLFNDELVDFLRVIRGAEHLEPAAFKKHIIGAVEAVEEILSAEMGAEL